MAANAFKRLIVGSFLLKLVAAGLGLAVYAYLARLLPVFEFGLFALCMSVAMLLAGIIKQGVENLIIRFCSEVARENLACLYGACLLLIFAVGALVVAIVFALAQPLSVWLNTPDMAALLPFVGLYALFNGMQAVNAALLNALHKPKVSLLFSGVLSQFIFLTALVVVSPSSPYFAFTMLLCCQGLSLVASFVVAFSFCPPTLRGVLQLPLGRLGVANAHYFIISLLMLITQQISPIVVAKYATLEEVAYLAIAIKVTAFFAYPLMAVNKVCGPHYSRLYFKSDTNGLANLAKVTRRQLTLIASVGLVCVFLLVEPLLQLLDGGYVAAANYIKILALGQWVNLATGSAVLILLMTGHERVHLYQNLAVTCLYFCALLILVPYFGAIAAASLMAGAMAVKNLLSLYSVNKTILR